jgi:hypothetical protein
MVQREARDRDIEARGFVQIFDPTAAEDPPAWGLGIDRHDVIAATVQGSRQPAISASHFEDASRRCW